LRRAVLWAISVLVCLIAMGCLLLYLPDGRVAWLAMALLLIAYKLGLIVDTVRIARRRERANQWYQRWWFYLGYLVVSQLVVGGVVQLSRTYWEEASYIPTGSMSPTILAGDRILVDKLRYRFVPVARGDAIVFRIDNQKSQLGSTLVLPGRQMYVKRVIGVPGDVIEYRDEKLIRNGSPVEEPYAYLQETREAVYPPLQNTPRTIVGEGELFVVGDNRRASNDSRIFGCIPLKDVVGKVSIVYWSRETPLEDQDPSRPATSQRAESTPRIRWERFGLRIH
jgi:signal peptidase I